MLFCLLLNLNGANWTKVFDSFTSDTTLMSDTVSVAAVDANGLTTLVAPGKAAITASYDNGFGLVAAKIVAECI